MRKSRPALPCPWSRPRASAHRTRSRHLRRRAPATSRGSRALCLPSMPTLRARRPNEPAPARGAGGEDAVFVRARVAQIIYKLSGDWITWRQLVNAEDDAKPAGEALDGRRRDEQEWRCRQGKRTQRSSLLGRQGRWRTPINIITPMTARRSAVSSLEAQTYRRRLNFQCRRAVSRHAACRSTSQNSVLGCNKSERQPQGPTGRLRRLNGRG